MGLEIERRFIVKEEEWKNYAIEEQELQQGYLSNNFQEWIIRMRIIDKKNSEITFKALAEGITNYEFEYPIPLNDALCIWSRITKKISKKRFLLNFRSEKWLVDCFQEENFPLVIAEVELDSENELIKQPIWCGKEITGIKKFSNASLAEFPISNWSSEEKKSFNLLKNKKL